MKREKKIKIISIEEEIQADNDKTAEEIRRLLTAGGTSLVNIMASPGAGKTSLLLRSLETLRSRSEGRLRCAVIEADMDSQVDAERIAEAGVEALQIRTGGFCHVDARMLKQSLDSFDLELFDLIFLENVGNLICPAQFDTGARLNVMILSVPEGDDKPLKYPLMFRRCDALVVNKMDYLAFGAEFDLAALEKRVEKLNPDMKIFPLSCKSGEGLDEWCNWLLEQTELRP